MSLGIGLLNVNGLTATVTHMFNHAMMKAGLFLALATMIYRVQSSSLNALAGVGRSMPLTTGAFTIMGVGLIGVPFTAGFISKWYLITGAMEKGWMPVAVLLIVSSLMAVVYIGKIIDVMYFKAPPEDSTLVKEAPKSMLIPCWIFAILTLYFGLDTRITAGLAGRVASNLLGAS